MYNDKTETRAIPIARLKELLAGLPDDHLIFAGRVGNLGILNPDFDFTGYIDVRYEELVSDARAEAEEPLFYIVNTEYSKDYAVFWAAEGKGYTPNLRAAGLFDKTYCDQFSHVGDLLFIPKEKLTPEDERVVISLSVARERATFAGKWRAS